MYRLWTPILATAVAVIIYSANDHGFWSFALAFAGEHPNTSCSGSGDLTPAEAICFRRSADPQGADPAQTVLYTSSFAPDLTSDACPR